MSAKIEELRIIFVEPMIDLTIYYFQAYAYSLASLSVFLPELLELFWLPIEGRERQQLAWDAERPFSGSHAERRNQEGKARASAFPSNPIIRITPKADPMDLIG